MPTTVSRITHMIGSVQGPLPQSQHLTDAQRLSACTHIPPRMEATQLPRAHHMHRQSSPQPGRNKLWQQDSRSHLFVLPQYWGNIRAQYTQLGTQYLEKGSFQQRQQLTAIFQHSFCLEFLQLFQRKLRLLPPECNKLQQLPSDLFSTIFRGVATF